MCQKRGYQSERAARQAHQSAGWRFKLYKCHECRGLWHMANGEKSERFRVHRVSRSLRSSLGKLAPARTLAEVEAMAARMRGVA